MIILTLYFLSKHISFKLNKTSQINIQCQDHCLIIAQGKGNMVVQGILPKVTHEACSKTKLEVIFSVLPRKLLTLNNLSLTIAECWILCF